ncbi:MAG: hypothetical protein ACI8ZM_002798 [Crocinitomix sp.]|jgi:hypothetical protein
MASESELSKLQAVKELIFGQEIQNYDAEFKEIHKEIDENKAQNTEDTLNQQKALNQLEKAITARIDRLEVDLMKKIAVLDNKKADRAKLGKMLIQIGEKLQDN